VLGKAASQAKEWFAARSKDCVAILVHTCTPSVEPFVAGTLTEKGLLAL